MKSILIVDDDHELRALCAEFLRSAGYQCLTSHIPTEALELIKSTSFDLIISDFNMPGMTGIEFIKVVPKMVGTRPRPAMILMTGDIRACVSEEALRAGACAVMTKPYERNTLLQSIGTVLADHSMTAPSLVGCYM